MSSLIVTKKMSNEDAKDLEGKFIDLEHYDKIINEDVDVFFEEDGKYVLLFSLRKKVIPSELSKIAYESYGEVAKKTRTNARGKASGIADINKIRGNIIDILDKGKFKTRVMFSDGSVSKYTVSNSVNSIISGYYDRDTITKTGKPFSGGRETSFNEKHRDKWNNSVPYIQYVDRLFQSIYPQQHQTQKDIIGKNPFVIADTIFSTVTINHNFRCATHLDNNDLKDGYSMLTVCQKGTWEGFYLGYPEYKICANVKEGDAILMNPHVFHSNTNPTITSSDYERLSFVFYFRNGLLKSSIHD
jgi:hypothetical protein